MKPFLPLTHTVTLSAQMGDLLPEKMINSFFLHEGA